MVTLGVPFVELFYLLYPAATAHLPRVYCVITETDYIYIYVYAIDIYTYIDRYFIKDACESQTSPWLWA